MLTETRWEDPPDPPVLTPDEVHVWRASLRPSPVILDRLGQMLSDDERKRAGRFQSSIHRDAFVAGRGILRDVLSRYIGIDPTAIPFHYGPHGKPALTRPVECSGISFNASNAGEIALYALTLEREIGIDVEEIRPMPDSGTIAEMFFSARENESLRALRPGVRDLGFFQCWTRKEAYIKAIGDGLSLPLSCFDVTFGPNEPARLLTISGRAEEAEHWMMCPVDPGEGYVGALAVHCSSADCARPRLYSWQPE
jgi:4'-phosphopantetheinyl transferase